MVNESKYRIIMNTKATITAFKAGSIRELIVIALPLIIVTLSDNIMIFIDRVLLAHYSLTSFNAVTLASQAIEIFQYAMWAIAGLTEMFVAKSHARRDLSKMARPCWQMIYLSVLSLPIMILLSQYSGGLILHGEYQVAAQSYYSLMMYSIPLMGMVAALSGFFIGRGKLKLVLLSTIVINVINLTLDIVLIFGIPHYLSPMGATGAAISALISLSLQVICLFWIFLSRENRKKYHTGHYYFHKQSFINMLKVGSPIAAGHAGEMFGWLVLIKIFANDNPESFTIISIGSTLYLVFAFFIDGLYRALSTIIGHQITAGYLHSLHKTLRNAMIALFAMLMLIAIPFIIKPNIVFSLFNLSKHLDYWHHNLSISLVFIWVYFMLSGIFWVFASLLTAKHDTKFMMAVNTIGMWLLTIAPIYLLVKYATLSTTLIWPIIDIYMLTACVAVIFRYKVKT
tara:strand:- start:140686 stop:142050 length:1365 start_codon:yes stop_codon:yes gene_type:complete